VPSTTGTATATRTSTFQAGTLTAGTWDDNDYFSFYLGYLSKAQFAQMAGLPQIVRADRMTITVTNDGIHPLTGATVTVKGPNGKIFESITGADGRVLFFPSWAGVASGTQLEVGALLGTMATTIARAGDQSVMIALPGNPGTGPATLDIAMVLDTTGSMGDELQYLQVELDNIAAQISDIAKGVQQRWALVVYRDEGDAYVVRTTPFTTLAAFRTALQQQSAGGGGDEPEAVDQALAAAGTLSWSAGSAARVVFWVADAPHHAGKEGGVVSALATLRSKGVHVYPVAASGVGDLAQFTMRTAAQVTGGRYMFLTDDSGVGNAHAEPVIPCYRVTSLQKAMTRMISAEVTGRMEEPASADVIRQVGTYKDERCQISTNVDAGVDASATPDMGEASEDAGATPDGGGVVTSM
jgi:hypothetical protein